MLGEQFREQPGLHDRRVLILVEKHDAVLLTVFGGERLILPNQLQSQGDLIAVFDETAPEFGCLIRVGEFHQHGQRRDLVGDDVDLWIGAGAARGQVDDRLESLGELHHPCTIREVLGQGSAELQHVGRELIDRPSQRREAVIATRYDHPT